MRVNAGIGAIAWLACAWGAWHGHFGLWLFEALFLLAPLVLVPLGLALVEAPARGLTRHLQLAGALCAAAAFVIPRGHAAAALAAVWLAYTLLLGARGVLRLWAVGFSNAPEAAIGAALAFVPVGGGWFTLSRLGARPLGFEEPIVLLTAIHFHYAAFTALVLIGLTGRMLRPSPGYRLIVAGAITGTPLLAAGITFSPRLELVGALVLASALAGLGLLMLARVIPNLRSGGARMLLLVSALSTLVAMAFALAYAWGEWKQQPLVTIATMARVHGTLNALGFGLCGLLGWTLAVRAGGARR